MYSIYSYDTYDAIPWNIRLAELSEKLLGANNSILVSFLDSIPLLGRSLLECSLKKVLKI